MRLFVLWLAGDKGDRDDMGDMGNMGDMGDKGIKGDKAHKADKAVSPKEPAGVGFGWALGGRWVGFRWALGGRLLQPSAQGLADVAGHVSFGARQGWALVPLESELTRT